MASSLPAFFTPSALASWPYRPCFTARRTTRDLPIGICLKDTKRRAPGTRVIFYWSLNAEPDVIALDESTKETITTAEGTSFAELFTQPDISKPIRVPVLIVVGQFDLGFCTPPLCPEAQAEPLFYAREAALEIKVLENCGHDLNLHLNAQAWFAIAGNWSRRHFDQ